MKKYSLIVLACSVAVLGACKHEGSTIQKQYAADRKECRSYAEMTAGGAPMLGDAESQHLGLVTQFANCMHKRGWAVNKPPGEKKGK